MAIQMKTASRAIEVLLVEDNRGDVTLLREVLRGADFPVHLSVAKDGVEALRLLDKEGPHSMSPLPDVILLDLHMPRKGGLAVLSEIKRNRRLKKIPVFITTTSNDESDMRIAYRLKADYYFVKPMELEYYSILFKKLENIWVKFGMGEKTIENQWRDGGIQEVQDELVVTNKLGLNLRTGAELVKITSGFKSGITVEKNGDTADGKSLLGLIALAVEYGSKLKFKIHGDDAEEAMEAIRDLVDRKFGEKE